MVNMRRSKNGANFKSLYTANTVAALYSARLGDSNELRLAAIGRYGDTLPYRYLNFRPQSRFIGDSSWFIDTLREFAPERILARKTGGVYEPVWLITINRPEKCCWCVLKA